MGRAGLLWVVVWAGCYDWAVAKTQQLTREQGALRPGLDAIIVPGCPARPDGTPSSCIERRVQAAVAAWRSGLSPRLLFSGAAVSTPWPEAEVMARRARELGVPDSAILVEERARHTQQNMRYAARMLRPRGWLRVVVVTDPFQMPFAIGMARFAGLEPFALPTVPPLEGSAQRRRLVLDDLEPLRRIAWW